MRFRLAPALLLVAAASAQEPSAQEIMARVAANQDRSERMRAEYVYNQSVLIRFHRGNRKLAREESSEFIVSPTPDGTTKERTSFLGKYVRSGEVHEYDQPNHNYKSLDIDGDLISDLAEDLTDDGKSRDGISGDLFPLTGDKQKHYQFRLEGRERYQGREIFRMAFRPVDKSFDTPWEGEALIDASQYHPIVVTTRFAKKLPFLVRTMLGTNFKQVGFKVTYQEVDDGLWFPASYGGEFVVRGLFFYKRRISLSLRNSSFERTEVTSTINYGGAAYR